MAITNISLVKNIGFDGSGVHCEENLSRTKNQVLNNDGKFNGVSSSIEDANAFKRMRMFYINKTYYRSIISNLLQKTIGSKNFNKLKKIIKN